MAEDWSHLPKPWPKLGPILARRMRNMLDAQKIYENKKKAGEPKPSRPRRPRQPPTPGRQPP